MSQLTKIEELAKELASAYVELDHCAAIMKAELRATQQRELPPLKRAAERVAQAKDELELTIKAAPALFVEPKTRVFSGIRLGFKKQKGKVVFDDEAATIKRIRKEYSKDQAELLIRVRESVHKPAVYDLEVKDAKRLGIRIEDDTDEVYIKQAITDLDRLIDGWLEDDDEDDEAA